MPAVMQRPAGGWTLGRGESGYPDCLELSPRPPAMLRGFGDQGLLRYGLAVVGSRKATPYGLACAREFAGWAAERGVIVISGAAYGCDRAAHEAALEAGGSTVAVLGCGADVDYPRSAAGLLRTLRDRHAVVSELGWGAPPTRYTFPERNRIIAALSAIVLVVEATPRSGTSSTVDHALDAGRQVCAVPGSVFSHTSRGCNSLIVHGAPPITDTDDLRSALEACCLLEPTLPEGPPRPAGRCSSASIRPGSVAHRVARALLADPMRTDDAANALGLDVPEVARIVSQLESNGTVARYPDGRYGPCRSP